MRVYRVYFRDSNQRMFKADNMYEVMQYTLFELGYMATDIVKIEEV